MSDPLEAVKRMRQDQEDKRRLRGAYAPKPGICRVCGGSVVATISFQDDGRIGGPPIPAYISSWHCESCMITYHKCPPAPSASNR